MEIKVLYKQGKSLKLMAIYNCSISVIKCEIHRHGFN
jgi:hypothetical protein